jgi:hypothetical protein
MNTQWTFMDPEGRVAGRQISGGRIESMLAANLPPNTDVLPYVAPAPLVPKSVSRFQGRAALLQAGYLDAIEAYMANPATQRLTRIAWEDAQDWERNSPTVLAMLALLGLSEAQGNQLFIVAKGITA